MQQADGTTPNAVTYANLWWDGHWLRDATVVIDAMGRIIEISTAARAARGATANPTLIVPGVTLPGLVNAHCHAFQRVLGPLTQHASNALGSGQRDDFWSWRTTMYALAGQLTQIDLEAIAGRCYLELLRGGYTSVAEFLYLHRLGELAGGDGRHALNADIAIATAAKRTGMALTLLPTLYQYSDFGNAPPTEGQTPFVRSTGQFLEDWQTLSERYPASSEVSLGIAFHSLRAVDIDTISRVALALRDDPLCRCIHIHVAEQPAEVAGCLRQYGLAPVALLAARGLLSPQWALVHATHASEAELAQLRAAQSTLVLCPTTEADLGDGCPAVAAYLEAGGSMAVGSDSNIGRHALGELRQLEWSQRLARGRRNVLATAHEPAVADRLYRAAFHGGRDAIGQAKDHTIGKGGARADFVTYDADAGDWDLQAPEDVLSALVFDAAAPQAQQVLVGGRWVIRNGRHPEEAQIEAQYRTTLQRLGSSLRSGTS